MEGNSGNRPIFGSQSSDELHGTDGADHLFGMQGDDTLDGGLGADVYNGGAGNDRYVLSDDAIDTLHFKSSNTQQDILDISELVSGSVNSGNLKSYLKVTDKGVYLDPAGQGQFSTENQIARFAANNPPLNAIIAVQIADTSIIQFDRYSNADTSIVGISESELASASLNDIAGTAMADTIMGTAQADNLMGLAGDDVLNGGAGADFYDGGEGSDHYVLADSESVETLKFISNNEQQDVIDISALLPSGVTAENISNFLNVTEDGVYIDSEGEGEFSSEDLVAVFSNDNPVFSDEISIQISEETVVQFDWTQSAGIELTDDNPFLSTEALSQRLDLFDQAGGGKRAFLNSKDGQRFHFKLDEHDLTHALGGEGDELLDASSVSERGSSQKANEADHAVELFGGKGRDTLRGNDDGTLLDGGEGNDRIEAGKGRNLLIGGSGEDEYALSLESSTDEIKSDMLYDFTSKSGDRDILDLKEVLPESVTAQNIHSYVKVTDEGVFIDTSGKAHFNEESQLARFGERSDIDNIVRIKLADGSGLELNRSEAISSIQGDSTADKMKAGEGSDTLYGNAGDDVLDGDALASTKSADFLYGGEGNDKLYVDNLDLTSGAVEGGVGFDTARIKESSGQSVTLDMHASGIEKAIGGDSDDVLDGSGFTDTSGGYNKSSGAYDSSEAQRLDLYGRDGADTLKGGVGRDYLDGGSDDDILSGGAGRDFISGGAGDDTFILADDDEVDTLWDFKSTSDQHDILDVSAFVSDSFDYNDLADYLNVDSNYVYFDKTGQGTFTYSQAIAKLGGKSVIDEPIKVQLDDIQITFDPAGGDIVLLNTNAPTAIATGQGIDEGSSEGTAAGSVSHTDVDGPNPVAYAISGGNDNGYFAINSSTGEVTLTAAGEAAIDYEASASHTIQVTASDGTFVSAPVNLTVTLNDVNEAPVVANNIVNQSVAEDSQLTFQVPLNTFSDVDGDSLNYTATLADGSALPDWLTFNSDSRTFSGAPDNENVGTLNLKVTATDPDGLNTEAQFNLDVTNVNDGPIQVFQESGGLVSIEAENFHSSVSREGSSWSTIADGGSSGGEKVATASNGMWRTGDDTEGNSPELTYEINFDSPGTYYVWMKGQIMNGGGDSLHIGVDGDYNHTNRGFTNFGHSNNWSSSGHSTITIDEAGQHQVNLWLREAGLSVDKVVLTKDSNFTPSGSGPAQSEYLNAPADQAINEELSFTYTLAADAFVDVDAGDVLSLTASLANGDPLPAWLSFDDQSRTFSGTPDDSDIGDIVVRVTASDGQSSHSADFSLSVAAINDTPDSVSLDSTTVSENSAGAVVGAISTSDNDAGDSHTYTLSDNRFEVVDGQLKLKDGISLNHESESTVNLTVTSTDTSGASVDEAFTLNIVDANDAPIVSSDVSKSSNEDVSFTLTESELLVNTTDADNDTLSVSNVTVASGQVSVVDNGDSTWTVTPNSNWSGNAQIDFDISDGNATVSSQADLTVTPDADTPTLEVHGSTVISQMDFNGGLASGWTSENSVESHESGGPVGSSRNGTRVVELDAEGSSNSPDAFYYSVDTSQGHDHEVSLWVKQRGSYDGTDEIEVVWNGQVIQTIDPGTSWGEVKVSLPDTEQSSTQLTIREVAGQNDGVGPLLDEITVTRFGADESVDPAYDKAISSNEDSRIALDLSASLNDSDGSETMVVALSGIPAGFGLADGSHSVTTDGNEVDVAGWNLANITLSPVSNHETDFTLTLSATATESSGGDVETVSQSIRVDLQPVQDAPDVAGVDLGSSAEDTSLLITEAQLLANSSDVDAGDSLSVTNLSLANDTHGAITDNGNGTWSYTPTANFNGNDVALNFTVSDGNASDNQTATATVDVTAVNDGPESGSALSLSTDEDQSFVVTEAELLANASDVDVDTLSVSNVRIDSGSVSVADNGDGTWTVSPLEDWSGSSVMLFDISDGQATVSGQADIAVSGVADAPSLSVANSTTISSMDFESDGLASGWSSENAPEINQASVYGVTDASGGNGNIMDLDDSEASAATVNDAIRYTVDTSEGFDHEVSFATRVRPDSLGTDEFEVVWNGEILQTITPTSSWETLTFKLPADGNTSGQLEIRETSGAFDDHGALFDDVTINKLNSITIDEDTSTSFELSAGLTDSDGSENLSSVAVTGVPSGYVLGDGSNSVTSDGSSIDISSWDMTQLTMTPAANANGTVSVTISAMATESSGDTATTSQSIDFVIQTIDDAPVAGNTDLGSSNEDTDLVITQAQLLANSSDVDGDSLSITALTLDNGSHGTLTDNGDSTWT
ncbi:MAG: tandem-95 repeat protein, partial [Endozoicomonas sp.]|uniref:tandem-95 repeat protein n=1 Tax=Endozoicomonas sp. TaxID=1892382 RepID=UPI003D9BA54A